GKGHGEPESVIEQTWARQHSHPLVELDDGSLPVSCGHDCARDTQVGCGGSQSSCCLRRSSCTGVHRGEDVNDSQHFLREQLIRRSKTFPSRFQVVRRCQYECPIS